MREQFGKPRALRLSLPLIVGAALGALYLLTLAPGVTWANDGADSGDLVAAAATLGIAHPSGYPTYLLLARLFLIIPAGELAFRAGLLSVVSGVGAALCMYAIVRELVEVPGWRGYVAAAGAALLCGLAPMLWSQSVIAEVYALNALFSGLSMWFALRALRAPVQPAWAERAEAVVVGLALGNHLTIGLLAIGWFGAGAIAALRRHSLAPLLNRLVGVAAGLLVYLYLPLRARAHPPINWGDPRDLAGFWWTVSGALYRPLSFGVPLGELAGRLVASAGLIAAQCGAVGMLLALIGLLCAPPSARAPVWASAIVAAAYVLFASAYDTADAYLYMIPAVLIVAAWAGLGLGAALSRLQSWPGLAPLALAGLAAALAWHAATTFPKVDASADRRAIDFAAHVLSAAPQNAIIAAESDLDAFPLWYDQYALGRRPDVILLVDPLLDFSWYRGNLGATYPALAIPPAPSPDGSWLDAVRAANPHLPICRTSAESTPAIACEQ